MLILQNVKIEGLLSFRAYFHFRELYKLLQSEDAYLFYDFGRDCLVNTSVREDTIPTVKTYLFGINGLDGSGQKNTGALRLLRDPELCLEETIPVDPKYTPPVFSACDGGASGSGQMAVLQNYDIFRTYIFSLFRDTYSKLKLLDPTWEQMKKSVSRALDIVTEKGKRRFPLEAAAEMYLYFLLHALAGVQPDNKQSLSALKADLDRLCPVSEEAQLFKGAFVLSCDASGSSSCPLAYYTGSQNQEHLLNVVEFKNPTKDPITVWVKDTVLNRTIPAKKSVYALRKGGQLVCFLPRFRMDGKIATYLWEGSLYNEFGGIREKVDTELAMPVSWARSNEYGTFIVDKTGKLDESAAWPDNFPEKPVVMADTCALDYCMLFADGTAQSRIRKRDWNHLIFVNIGMNSAAAIDNTRQVVLADGKRIPGIQAAEVRTYKSHYICMDAKGNIQTDTGLTLEETVYGIAASRDGFAVACRNHIRMYDFGNNCRKQWNVSNVSEIAVDDGLMAYYDAQIGEVVFLDF